jgi:hypothetical protein
MLTAAFCWALNLLEGALTAPASAIAATPRYQCPAALMSPLLSPRSTPSMVSSLRAVHPATQAVLMSLS